MSVPLPVELIYEAAFDPDRWENVLTELGERTGSAGGSVLVYDDLRSLNGRAVGVSEQIRSGIMDGPSTEGRTRIDYFMANPVTGFLDALSYLPARIACDAKTERLRALGLHHQLGAIIPMPSGEMAAIVLYRREEDGPYPGGMIDDLNRVYPHLSRAAFVSARLGLEHAQATVSALGAMGMPAAVLSRTGKVRAANDLLDSVTDILMPVAFGSMAIARPAANRLYQEAVARAGEKDDGGVRSIPVPAVDGQEPHVVHLLPLYRSAREIFSGADMLVVASRVSPSRIVPEPTVLMGLFDLTPAEVKLAAALAKGQPLVRAAEECGIKLRTARSYLEGIFRKTGTHQQSELVALLKSTRP